MIKKSHREKLNQTQEEISVEEAHKSFGKAIDLINKVHKQIYRIPAGYYVCPECEKNKPVYINEKPKKNILIRAKEKRFYFSYCNKCDGSGLIDFVSNVMKTDREKEFSVAIFDLPIMAAEMEIKELASTIFYLLYNKHNYFGFNFDLEKPEKNIFKNKYTKEFVNYFIEFKKNRDARKKFIEKNFIVLQKKVLKIQNIADFNKDKSTCTACGNYPFDLTHNEDFDTLKLLICGKCYGNGHQNNKDSRGLFRNYIVDIENPDYSNISQMQKSLFNTAEIAGCSFKIELDRIQFQEKS